jgi:hypothetical protein
MGAPTAAAPARHEGHSVGFNLAAIAVVIAVVGIGFAYLIDAAKRARGPKHPAGTVARTIGSTELNVPAAWLTGDADEPTTGFVKQVNLEVRLPLGPEGATRLVEVTLTQRSRVRPSASLLDGVYLHEFQAAQLTGPPGLIGKPMSAAEGYANETVWYDPITASPFVAKCQTPIVKGQPGHCLRTVYLGPGMAAVYGFDDDVLINWRRFDAVMHPLLTEIGAL